MLILVGDHLAFHNIEGRLYLTRQQVRQESPAIADKHARRKIVPIRRAYNVVADNTDLSSFV